VRPWIFVGPLHRCYRIAFSDPPCPGTQTHRAWVAQDPFSVVPLLLQQPSREPSGRCQCPLCPLSSRISRRVAPRKCTGPGGQKGKSGRRDSNPGPPAPKAGALPGCATPRSGEDSHWNSRGVGAGPVPLSSSGPPDTSRGRSGPPKKSGRGEWELLRSILPAAHPAGTQAPKEVEGKDPGGVAVTPVELYRVPPHVVNGQGMDPSRHRIGNQDSLAGHLIHTGGARTSHPEKAGGIIRGVPVPPADTELGGIGRRPHLDGGERRVP
jgi:hypothetical protein